MCELFRSPLGASFLFFPWMQRDWGAWTPWGKFVRDRARIDALLYAEIADRRQQNRRDRVDILSLLMDARDERSESMSDPELRDELMTLLFAGHETTATAMALILIRLGASFQQILNLRLLNKLIETHKEANENQILEFDDFYPAHFNTKILEGQYDYCFQQP